MGAIGASGLWLRRMLGWTCRFFRRRRQMDSITEVDGGVVVEKTSTGFAEVHGALANLVPPLRPHHHLTGGTTLLLHHGDSQLAAGNDAVIFLEQFWIDVGRRLSRSCWT